jgi:hypothetical protein
MDCQRWRREKRARGKTRKRRALEGRARIRRGDRKDRETRKECMWTYFEMYTMAV